MMKTLEKFKAFKPSLAALLAWLVTFSVVITAAILLAASYQTKKQGVFNATMSSNLASATIMGQMMESLFTLTQTSLQDAATYFNHIDFEDKAHNQAILKVMLNNSHYFNSLIIVDKNGVIRYRVPEESGMVNTTIVSDAMKNSLHSKHSYLSSPYLSPVTGRIITLMSEPIYDDQGEYRGFIAGSIYLEENNVLNRVFGNGRIEENGSYFYVVEQEGRLLFHPDASRIGEDVSSNEAVQALRNGESGKRVLINTRGTPSLVGFKVTSNGWGVVVSSPISLVHEELRQDLYRLLGLMIVPFAATLWLAIRLSRQLARPFSDLMRTVGLMGRGGDDAVPGLQKRYWNREADLLTRTMLLAFENIRNKTEQLMRDAHTDPLTGLTNRRTFEEIVNRWCSEEIPFGLFVLDIDHFKLVNDTYGHQMGDIVLKNLADLVLGETKNSDVVSRYGGEEFVVLLPFVQEEEAMAFAERLRRKVAATIMPIGRPITVSIGIAVSPANAKIPQELFELADQALYTAKRNGRNCSMLATVVQTNHEPE